MRARTGAFVVVIVGLAVLATACGSGGNDGWTADTPELTEGQAPPAATSVVADGPGSPEAVGTEEAADSDIEELLESAVLQQQDVEPELIQVMNMSMPMDFSMFLASAGEENPAHISMFSDNAGEHVVISMVFYMNDSSAASKTLQGLGKLPFEEVEGAFGMLGGFGGLKLIDTREIDVSRFGEGAFARRVALENADVGELEARYVFWREGPIVAMVISVGPEYGGAHDVVPPAERMAARIEARVN